MARFIVPFLSALLLVVIVGVAGAALGVDWAPGPAGAEAQADALPTRAEPLDRTVLRCRHCGTIESKRELPRGTADPAASTTYEYTLRMADGSSSVFQDALLVSWRLGERVIVIGGITSDRKN